MSYRITPERKSLHWQGLSYILVATGAALLVKYGPELISQNDTSDTIPSDSTGPQAENEVFATPIPLMPEEQDTTPGLMPHTLDVNMNDNASVAEVLNRIWEMYRTNPESLTQAEANFMFEQILTGPTTFENDRQLTIETLGLGFTPETVEEFTSMDAYARRYFTTASRNAALANNDKVTPLVFNGNPAENTYTSTVFTEEGGVDRTFLAFQQFDNVRAFNVVAALDLLKEVRLSNGQTAWSALNPSERMDFALELSDLWFNSRIEGAVSWGELTFNYQSGNRNIPLFSVISDEEGFVACRVEADDNSDERTEQNLTTHRIIITEQESGDLDTPFNENSRFGAFAIAVAVNTDALSDQFGSLRGTNLVNALLRSITSDAGAYEIIDLSTGYRAIPAGYEFDGPVDEEGDIVSLFRPCGRAPQVEIIPTAIPEIVNPPVVTTPPPQETPPPTPTPEPPKDDIGDQTNPDGETEAPPTGGTINDPEAEQGSDTNPGSGH